MNVTFFTHRRTYKLPAWSTRITYYDGIYINGGFFENNISILDQVIWLYAQPQGSYFTSQWVRIGVPTYDKNLSHVTRMGHEFYWLPKSTEEQSQKLLYDSKPYGIGLNTIAVTIEVSLARHYDAYWFVHYIMEVYW